MTSTSPLTSSQQRRVQWKTIDKALAPYSTESLLPLLEAALMAPTCSRFHDHLLLLWTRVVRSGRRSGAVATADVLPALVDAVVHAAPGRGVLTEGEPNDVRAVVCFDGMLLHPGDLDHPLLVLRSLQLTARAVDDCLVGSVGFGLGDVIELAVRYTDRRIRESAYAWQVRDEDEDGETISCWLTQACVDAVMAAERDCLDDIVAACEQPEYNMVSNQDGTTRDHDGVDSPATLDRPLKGTKGTVDFDALALKLPSSIAYDLRVFAVDQHGKTVGQASPTSLLGYDDGLAPDDTNLTNFAIVPGGTSVAAVESPTGEGSVYDYNAATGTYGRKLTSDPAYGSIYEVFGVDSAHHTLVLHKQTTTGEQWLETYDTSTGNAVGSPVRVDDQYVVTGGRVDAKRHRAAVLASRSSDRAGFVLPVDLATGTQGEPLELATPDGPSQYSLLEVDESTGVFFAQSGILINANCVAGLGSGTVAAINLDSGTVTHSQEGIYCAGDLASDQKGNLYEMWYHRPSRVFAGTEYLSQLGGGDPVNLGNQPDLGVLAVDGVHQLALLAFKYPELKPTGGFQQYGFTDNNGTGRIVVVDLKTGKTVRTVTGVEYPQFGSWTGQLDSHHERVVQLDPATRTGWTYAGDGSQIQQFSY